MIPYFLFVAGPPINLAAGAAGVSFYVIATIGLALLIGASVIARRRSVEAFAAGITVGYWIACGWFSLVLVI